MCRCIASLLSHAHASHGPAKLSHAFFGPANAVHLALRFRPRYLSSAIQLRQDSVRHSSPPTVRVVIGGHRSHASSAVGLDASVPYSSRLKFFLHTEAPIVCALIWRCLVSTFPNTPSRSHLDSCYPLAFSYDRCAQKQIPYECCTLTDMDRPCARKAVVSVSQIPSRCRCLLLVVVPAEVCSLSLSRTTFSLLAEATNMARLFFDLSHSVSRDVLLPGGPSS
jgi:hypothetical protein